MRAKHNPYVQYGCGWSAPQSWRNFDASPTLLFERIPLLGRCYTKNISRFPPGAEYGNIVKGLPVPPHSCRGIYCSHVLEHLALQDLRKALKNTRQMLAPDGVFRLVLPDLGFYINRYNNDSTPTAAMSFMIGTGLGQEQRHKGISGFLRAIWGNSRHQWMWDERALRAELERAGFQSIRRASFHDSADRAFLAVENAGRWANALGFECT